MTFGLLTSALVSCLCLAPSSGRETATEHLRTGIEIYDSGHPDLAKASFEDAIVADPAYARAYLLLGQLHHRSGRFQNAVIAFEGGLARQHIEPDTAAELHYELGRARLELARHETGTAQAREQIRRDAIASLKSALDANPRHYQAHYQLARVHDHLDAPAPADKHYRRCLELEPRYAPCYLRLGQMYIDYGHADHGFAVIATGLRTNTRNAYLWAGLGSAHLKLGKPSEAVRALKKSLALDPEGVLAHFSLGMAHAELRQRRRAVESLQAFLERADASVPDHYKKAAHNTIARMQDVI